MVKTFTTDKTRFGGRSPQDWGRFSLNALQSAVRHGTGIHNWRAAACLEDNIDAAGMMQGPSRSNGLRGCIWEVPRLLGPSASKIKSNIRQEEDIRVS